MSLEKVIVKSDILESVTKKAVAMDYFRIDLKRYFNRIKKVDKNIETAVKIDFEKNTIEYQDNVFELLNNAKNRTDDKVTKTVISNFLTCLQNCVLGKVDTLSKYDVVKSVKII